MDDPGVPKAGNLFSNASVPQHYQAALAPVVFEPWARVLLDRVHVVAGDAVLDVACGTGVLSRLASERAGRRGRVEAVDISPPMLAKAAALGTPAGGAHIEYLEGPAENLPVEDGSADVVLCQQGLQFFPEQPAAVSEFHRALKPGGTLGLAVWARGHRLEPFDHYAQALLGIGAPEPFPGAFSPDLVTMTVETIRGLLLDAGFTRVTASVVTLTLEWPSRQAAVDGILGTPFAALVARLDPERRRALDAHLHARFAPTAAAPGPIRRSAAVIARADRE